MDALPPGVRTQINRLLKAWGWVLLLGAVEFSLALLPMPHTFRPLIMLPGLAMIAGVAYSVNVTAKSPITATRITREVFMRVVREFPDFGAKVMSVLSGRLTGSVSEFDRVRQMLEKAPTFPRR